MKLSLCMGLILGTLLTLGNASTASAGSQCWLAESNIQCCSSDGADGSTIYYCVNTLNGRIVLAPTIN